jgi:hypothetical protein
MPLMRLQTLLGWPMLSSSSEDRALRGGFWFNTEDDLRSSDRGRDVVGPTNEFSGFGFRVASVPEPSTYALLAMTAAGTLWMTRKRR